MCINKEIEKMCKNLMVYKEQTNHKPEQIIKKNVLAELKLSEMLIASKFKKSPLSAHLLLRSAINKFADNEFQQIINQEEV